MLLIIPSLQVFQLISLDSSGTAMRHVGAPMFQIVPFFCTLERKNRVRTTLFNLAQLMHICRLYSKSNRRKGDKTMNTWTRKSTWLSLMVLVIATQPLISAPADKGIAQLQQTGKAFSAVAKSAMPAVVFIRVEQEIEGGMNAYQFNDPFDFFGDDMLRRFFGVPGQRGMPRQRAPRKFRREGAGSGFIISEDGYILTNSHVVGDATKITVKLHDGREFEAEKVGSDDKSEVAIIKIDADKLPTVALGDSSNLEVGEWVIAVGNPFGLTETVTAGIVSALGRSNIGITDYEDFIQTDAAINPGNSGGPLLNIDGEVIGINTAIYSQSGGYMGVGFAIPINMASAIKEQLIKDGKVTRGYLGVYLQELTPDLAESLGLDDTHGILIADVIEDSAAEDAGLKQGDIVLKLNGKPVRDLGSFRNRISSMPPDTKLNLLILRDGKEKTIKAVTGALDDADVASAGDLSSDLLGIQISDITPEMAERFGYEINDGVVITEVDPEGRAARAGLRPGILITGVNLGRTRDIDAFEQALSDAKDKGRLVLRVRNGRYHQYIAIPLD
jgi:serine protease Do